MSVYKRKDLIGGYLWRAVVRKVTPQSQIALNANNPSKFFLKCGKNVENQVTLYPIIYSRYIQNNYEHRISYPIFLNSGII